MNVKKTKGGLALIIFCALVITISTTTLCAENEIVTKITRVDTTQTLQSFDHIGEFHTIDFVGDYQYLLDIVNNWFADGKNQNTNNYFCSLFSALGNVDELLMGRNFDNPYCDILVGRYNPPDGYSNIALNRLADIGLPAGTNFQNLSYNQSLRLLFSPYFAADGVNEAGLAIGIAYVPGVQIQVDPTKESVWVTRVIREVLDYASTVDEALAIANSYNVFDTGTNNDILSHHYIVTDASEASYILEYVVDQFVAIVPTVDWQVLTNSHIYNIPLYQLLNGCWRYNILYTSLQNYGGCVDFREGFELLSNVSWGNQTNGTQWSTMYDINNCGTFISTYRDFENLVYVDVANFEFLNYSGYDILNFSYQDDNANYIIESEESAEFYLMFEPAFTSTGVTGILHTDDPDVDILNDEVDFGTVNAGNFGYNGGDPFIIQAVTDMTPHTVDFSITLVTDYDFEYVYDFSVFIGSGNLLLVNDDPENNYSSFYQDALTEHSRTGHEWDTSFLGEIPIALCDAYGSLIWFTGDASEDILSPVEKMLLKDFMDSGGNVFLTGQDVCECINGTDLFSDYFHAQLELEAWPFYDVSGLDADPVGDGITFSISGGNGANNQITQSAICADAQAVTCLTYDGCPVSCGVRYDGLYKSVLMSFGFEGISTLADRAEVMNRIMEYFEVPVSNDPQNPEQDIVSLSPAFPNPFSSLTNISFSLPHPEKVKIQIYNLKGQLVETLLDKQKPAGNHTMEWNAEQMSSGIYFIKLITEDKHIIQKVVVIK
ncbi:MAG: T9SS type A sorting domain-containing protein [Candidatus Cloacimonetes bacterium]|nr:T9SS type A sorting domain-containing protein [Candidatus Cloacimonadota bacterium]